MTGTYSPPSSFDPAIIEEILERLAGGQTLRSACSDIAQKHKSKRVPSRKAVEQWNLENVEDFAAVYQRARLLGYEMWTDQIIEIALDDSRDILTSADGVPMRNDKGDLVANPCAVPRDRLRIDTLKWFCGKMLPRLRDKMPDGASKVVIHFDKDESEL
jgi:Bacteriophage Sf6, terminase small subunit-like